MFNEPFVDPYCLPTLHSIIPQYSASVEVQTLVVCLPTLNNNTTVKRAWWAGCRSIYLSTLNSIIPRCVPTMNNTTPLWSGFSKLVLDPYCLPTPNSIIPSVELQPFVVCLPTLDCITHTPERGVFVESSRSILHVCSEQYTTRAQCVCSEAENSAMQNFGIVNCRFGLIWRSGVLEVFLHTKQTPLWGVFAELCRAVLHVYADQYQSRQCNVCLLSCNPTISCMPD